MEMLSVNGRYKSNEYYQCRICNAKRRREWYKTKKGKETIKRNNKNWQIKNLGKWKEIMRKNAKNYKIKHRDKYLISKRKRNKKFWSDPKNKLKVTAWGKVKYAIKKGELKKEPCVVCGIKEVHAHHKDYTKPLKVIWVCRSHHQSIHNGEITV